MIVPTGATSVSVSVQIVDDSGLPVTGLTAATFPAVKYSLAGPNASVSISLSDLALITSPWSSGGLKEREFGYFRIDVPNAAFASSGTVRLEAEASGKHLLAEAIQVGTVPTADPLNTAVPGAYAAGTAGYYLGTMGGDYVGATFLVGSVVDAVTVAVVAAGAITASSFAPGAIDSTAAPNLDVAVSSRAAPGDAMTLTAGERTAVATALLDLANGVETSVTVRQALRAMAAALAGKVTVSGGTYAALANTGTPRLVVTDDGSGNRSVTPTL